MNTGIKKYIFFLMILTIFVMSCTVLVFAEEYLDTISLKGKKSIAVINNTSGEVSIQDTYDTTVRTEAGIKYNKEFKSENENLKVQAAKEEVMREVELEAGKTIEFINDINEDIRVEVTGKVDYARYNSDGTLFDYRINDSGYVTFFKGKRIVITNKETKPITIYGAQETFTFEAQPKEEEAVRRVEVEAGKTIEFVNDINEDLRVEATGKVDYARYNSDGTLFDYRVNDSGYITIKKGKRIVITNKETKPITIYSGQESFTFEAQPKEQEAIREVEVEAGKTIEFVNDINEDLRVEATGKVDYARYNSDGTLFNYRVNNSGYITIKKGKRIVITNKETKPIIIRSGRESFVFEAQPKEEEAIRRVEVEVGKTIEFVNDINEDLSAYVTGEVDYARYNSDGTLLDYRVWNKGSGLTN